MKWIPTTQEAYLAIYKAHQKDFGVFGTCTLPMGDPRLGKENPYILTEWGFKGASDPLIKCVQTKENHEQKEYDCKYFIACADSYNED